MKQTKPAFLLGKRVHFRKEFKSVFWHAYISKIKIIYIGKIKDIKNNLDVLSTWLRIRQGWYVCLWIICSVQQPFDSV